jgi:hypothetical protein
VTDGGLPIGKIRFAPEPRDRFYVTLTLSVLAFVLMLAAWLMSLTWRKEPA